MGGVNREGGSMAGSGEVWVVCTGREGGSMAGSGEVWVV